MTLPGRAPSPVLSPRARARLCCGLIGVASALFLAYALFHDDGPTIVIRGARSASAVSLPDVLNAPELFAHESGRPHPSALIAAAMSQAPAGRPDDAIATAARLIALLERGASLSEDRTTTGATALHAAAGSGNVAAVQTLLHVATPADVNAADIHGRTPLIAAASAGHAEVVTLLLAAGADVGAKNRLGKMTALAAAARKNHVEVVRLLLAAGSDVHTLDTDTRSPISHAAEEGHLELVKLLVGAGARVDEGTSNNNVTPLAFASGAGRPDLVRFLLDSGATVDMQSTWDHFTPLIRAAMGHHYPVAQLLLGKGANVNAVQAGSGYDGKTALMWAAMNGDLAMVQLLVDAGADVNAKDGWKGDRTSVLAFARESGRQEVVEYLLSKGAKE